MKNKQLNDFTKGLISRISDDKIADNSFSDCMNIDLSENFLPKSAKGKIKVNDTAIANDSCMGMTIYNNKENGAYIVVACGGYLWYRLVTGGTFAKYQIDNNGTLEDVEIDPNVRVRFAQYNDRLFVFTGKYPVIENDSFDTACILVIYKTTATYIDRTSFYAWNKSGSVYYTLSATPASGDTIFTDLYRTKIAATVSSVSGDTLTDSNGATYTRTSGSDKIDPNVPKGIKYPIIHQERLFGFGSIEDDNGIYWSQPYEPTTWTPVYGLNYDTVGKDDGEKITGAVSFGGVYIYVFKQHNVYRYLTSGDIDSWQSNKVDTTYGCVAHETIKLFNGVLTYLSPDGVAQLNGNTAVLVDEAIRDKTTNVSIGNDLVLERSCIKNDNWNNVYASRDGITIKDNVLGTVHDVEFGSNKNISWTNALKSYGDKVSIVDESAWGDDPDVLRTEISVFAGNQIQDVSDDIVYHSDNFGNIETYRSRLLSGRYLDTVIMAMKYQTQSPTPSLTSGDYVELEILDSNYDVVATSNNKIKISDMLESSQPYDWQNEVFTFNMVTLNTSNVYYKRLKVTKHADFTIYIMAVHNNYTEYGGTYNEKLHTQSSQYISWNIAVLKDENHYYWETKEIDTYSENFNLQTFLTKRKSTYGVLDDYYIRRFLVEKFYIANYDNSTENWDDILNTDITEIFFDSGDLNLSYNLNLTGKRFLRIKRKIIVDTSYILLNLVHVSDVGIAHSLASLICKDNYDYQSEPITIAGSNPSGWGIAEIGRTGSDDVSNKATIYMRSGSTTTELENATYYEINNNEQITSSIARKILVQFKVVFPADSDNYVSFIKINYYTKESITKVCAIVWKNKYRLNMPKDNSSDNNSVEYILDKDGYWVIKDNENNFDYAFSVNDLFACSATDGFVYKKEVGYTNAGSEYVSYFVTKKFVLTDFENLFRKLKVRYVSVGVDISLGVSVDDGEYVNYTINANTNLLEVIKTLTGIVRGQTIKFKFSWTANNSTAIHNFCFYWKVLRQLNIG